MTEEEYGIIGALQLLLGDKDTHVRLWLIRQAFPKDALIFQGMDKAEAFKDELSSAHNMMSRALETCDGSSGLGAGAARNLHHTLLAAKQDLRDAAKQIDLSI